MNCKHDWAYERARHLVIEQRLARLKKLPRPSLLEKRNVTLAGRDAILQVEELAPGRVRALVAVRLGRELGSFGAPWTYPAEVQEAARTVAREAVRSRGVATHEGTFASGWMCEGELVVEALPDASS